MSSLRKIGSLEKSAAAPGKKDEPAAIKKGKEVAPVKIITEMEKVTIIFLPFPVSKSHELISVPRCFSLQDFSFKNFSGFQ